MMSALRQNDVVSPKPMMYALRAHEAERKARSPAWPP